MNMQQWVQDTIAMPKKKAIPVLSFPSIQLLDVTVVELISSSEMQAKGMKIIADRCDTAASLSMMDLSIEAEAFGGSIHLADDEVPTVVGKLIDTMEDAQALQVPAIGTGRTGLYISAIEQACRMITDRPVFAGVIGPFSLSGRLMDMTEIMIKCYTDPDIVHTVLQKTTDFLIEYIKAYKAVGANGVVVAEPAAGLLSPDLISEFSTPYVKQMLAATRSDDFAFVYHNCGNTIPLVENIMTIGADAYHFGNMIKMEEMMKLASPDALIMGNVDPSSQFRMGTPESIYAKTTEILNECSKYPNFVISSGCDVPPMASWDNIDSFFQAVDDFYKSK